MINLHAYLQMADLDSIQHKYSSMSDAQLLRLYENEKDGLTKEAIALLKEEMSTRGMNSESEIAIEADVQINSTLLTINRDLLNYILEKKEAGMDNAYIIGGMMERGLTEDEAVSIMNQIPTHIELRIQQSSSQILTGIALSVSGLSVSFLPLSHETNKALYIISYTIFIYGLIRFIHGISNKSRFTKIKNNKHVKNQTTDQ